MLTIQIQNDALEKKVSHLLEQKFHGDTERMLHELVLLYSAQHTGEEKEGSGKELAAILQKIADRGGPGIDDPQEWQREIRKDRPLPFREE